MLFYGIETLRDSGIRDIGLIVGHTPERIREIKSAVGDGSNFGIRVTYIEQDAPRGIAHAIKTAQEFLTSANPSGKFVVHLGDNIVRGGIKELVKEFEGSDADAFTLFSHIPELERKLNTWGSPEFKNGKLVKVIEKPKVRKNDLAFVGIYGFNASFFKAYEKLKLSPRNEYEIADAITALVRMRKKVTYHILEAKWWKDPGTVEGVLEANALLLDDLEPFNRGRVEDGAVVLGKVGIEGGTLVKRGAHIRGPVIIGRDCTIGGRAFIGPYTSIGDKTTVDNVEIEYSVVIGESTIDCPQRVTNSLIGRNVRIGAAQGKVPRAVRLVIGENSLVSI